MLLTSVEKEEDKLSRSFKIDMLHQWWHLLETVKWIFIVCSIVSEEQLLAEFVSAFIRLPSEFLWFLFCLYFIHFGKQIKRAAHRRQTAHRTSAPETQAFAHPNWRVLQTGCPCLHVTQTGCPCLKVLQNRYPCRKIFVAHVCTLRPMSHQKQQNDRTTIQQNPETKKNTKTQKNKQKHG